MSELDKNETESRILQAAEKVFVRDGFDGARMQDIADEANINKAMLHYYFRSKDKLFEQILLEKFAKFMPQVGKILMEPGLNVFQRFDAFIDAYYDLLQANPMIPYFIVNSAHRDPSFLLEKRGQLPILIKENLQKAFDTGLVRRVDPEQFLLSVMGMCVFPFLSRPVMQPLMQKSDEEYEQMLHRRRQELKNYIRCLLDPDS